MALLVLAVLGAAMGWLTSISTNRDSLRQSLKNIAIGSAGSLATFLLMSDRTSVNALSPLAILLGVVGALALLGLSLLVRQRKVS